MLIERDHIGIFGKMNSGKSSIMNLLTQQQTSIVDPTPGTTADTKTALQEIHGLGPVKLFDTAGCNEEGRLGDKKRVKLFNDLKECDLALVVIDPSTEDFTWEKKIIGQARELNKQMLVVYNIFKEEDEKKIRPVEDEIHELKFVNKIRLKANHERYRQPLLSFIIQNFESKNQKIELIPFLKREEYYVLVIPMDVQTPPGRYLRPQSMVEEYITRNWAYPVSFRLDLQKARSQKPEESEQEKKRFFGFIESFKKRPHAVITDSQAIDVLRHWVPENIMLTTFSITMINYFSRGRLHLFVRGISACDNLKPGEKVLIVEACNHSRIGEDIGTVQIPNFFKRNFPKVVIEHNFGREFQENEKLEQYKLIIHCGGCMIPSQQLLARIRDLTALGMPFTNYGLFLSYMQGMDTLKRVVLPWGTKTAHRIFFTKQVL
ncbi:GTP-binding protein [Candidatus Woesearchaeota archaeon]|nr:GTP-binding protein [Candidatus Woesearchaeota archaeon]